MKKGFLMVVSGPSGVGKGIICDILLRDNKDIKRVPEVSEVVKLERKNLPHRDDGIRTRG